ncbi:MAG: accessory gene regulator B family protein [Clostridioides sp.]|jgi:accessory gene regulator B|nr:accessory gene regulator B family protein [Clostridioides sp.]
MKSKVEEFTEYLISANIIEEEDKEVYIYGIKNAFILFSHIVLYVVIAVVSGMFKESVFFIVTYFALRMYAGGYHARTQSLCNFFSTTVFIMALLAIRYSPNSVLLCCLIVVVSSIIVFLLSPVEDQNKPLIELEKVMYRKKTYIVLAIQIIISLVLLIKWNKYLTEIKSIAMGLLLMAVVLILGTVKNYSRGSVQREIEDTNI